MNKPFDAGRRRFLNRMSVAAGTIASSPLVVHADDGDFHEWRGARRRHVNTGVNGFAILEATARKLTATYWEIDGAEATRSYYEHPLQLIGKLRPRRFEVAAQDLAQNPIVMPRLSTG